ncbi:MAG TPA: gamma-glutamylcyclotransferase family protein, partial [Solirubrobacteraceae bacterium]
MFGYASLLDRRDRDDDDGRPAGLADLTGYRRSWGVAMDNSLDIPGYKYYVDPATGSRPDVFVAFLTISASPGGRVNGALIEVSAGDLVELDRRERNYARVDVTDRLARAADGTDRLAGAAGVT